MRISANWLTCIVLFSLLTITNLLAEGAKEGLSTEIGKVGVGSTLTAGNFCRLMIIRSICYRDSAIYQFHAY